VLRNHERFNLWDGFSRKKSRLVVNCQEDDQNESSSEEEESSQSTPAKSERKREKKEDKVWWSKGKKWQWQPIIQAQGIGVLLLQLSVVMFVMRLLRPGIPLPGSEPRIQTTFVSVPYSEFLSKVNSNQVQKVEVDGVQVLFKLRDDGKWQESETSRLSQSSESLLRTVAPTKRVVYSTTRPGDIKTPYEKMLGNNVEFGSPEKRSGGFFNSALV
jgi:cell division protease FtsH